MISSEKGLAELLDDWVREKRTLITEQSDSIVAGRLSAKDAVRLISEFDVIGWRYSIEDGTSGDVPKSQVDSDFEPYRVLAVKPAVAVDRDFVLTNIGLADWLTRPPAHAVIEVTRLETAFETLSVRFAPRADTGLFVPEVLGSDPRRVVRESGADRIVPRDISHWLLRTGSDVNVGDPAMSVWADAAARNLMASLCNEVESPATVVFKGPPSSRYDLPAKLSSTLSDDGFRAVQQCARWVFSYPKEMETRHILLAAEISRSATGSEDISTLFKASGLAALEGAKIAFELGLNKISADTLKALADLRKAVSDEAAKLGDSTRQLASAVSGALFGGIGLIVARLTLTTSSLAVATAVFLIGIVLSLYVAATIASGYQFVAIQRELRGQWRNRLYRFLPENEYQKMVTDPAAKAEGAFRLASWISGLLAAALMVAVLFVTAPELWKGLCDWVAPAPAITQPRSDKGPTSSQPGSPLRDLPIPDHANR